MALVYTNENFPQYAVEALRKFGHDVMTTHDAGNSNQSISDDDVIKYAISKSRILVTLNKKDFIMIHNNNSAHAGIIVCSTDNDFARLASNVNIALISNNPATGKLISVGKNGVVYSK